MALPRDRYSDTRSRRAPVQTICAGRRASDLYWSPGMRRVHLLSMARDGLPLRAPRGRARPGDRSRRAARRRSVAVGAPPRAGAQRQRVDRARGVSAARERRPDRGPPEVADTSSGAARAPTAEPRAPRACAKPSRVTVSDAYTEILAAMRDPELVPLGCATVDPSYLPIGALNRILTQLTREMSTRRRALRGGARAAHAAPPDRAPRGRGRRRARRGRSVHDDRRDRGAVARAARGRARPGDVIAVESPAYFGVLQAIEGLGLRALEIPAHPAHRPRRRRVRGGDSRAQPVRALVVAPTVSNPLGSIMPDDERERLVEITRRADIPIIEDDVYGELVFDGSRPRPLRAFAARRRQPRRARQLGLEDARARLSRRLDRRRPLARSDRAHQVQPVARVPGAARHGGRRVPRDRAATIATCAGCAPRSPATSSATARRSSTQFPDGTRVSSPRGGFVLWVELPPGVDALDAPRAALRRGIVIAPGPLFSARQRFANFIRISAGTPWSERIGDAIRTLARLVPY